jgi:hypothetical protein
MNTLLNTTLATLQTISGRNKNDYIDAATLASICLATATLVEALKDQVTDLEDRLSNLWNYTGAYIGGASYAVGDVVTYNGELFYRKNSNSPISVGAPFAGSIFWDLIAAKGEQGLDRTPAPAVPAPILDHGYNNIMSQVISEASKIRRYFD